MGGDSGASGAEEQKKDSFGEASLPLKAMPSLLDEKLHALDILNGLTFRTAAIAALIAEVRVAVRSTCAEMTPFVEGKAMDAASVRCVFVVVDDNCEVWWYKQSMWSKT